MKIIFLGTPEFAVASLDILVQNNYKIVGVITAPDKPAGRGRQITQSAVKKYALENAIPVLQPTNLKDPDFLEELKSLKADLQIIVAFRMLPEAVWNMPQLGTFNLHASLLPQYRGAAPINWAIINGEKYTGVTTFFLNHDIDTGNIILQEKVTITDDETAGELHDKLMKKGSELVLKTVQQIEAKNYTLITQDQLISENNEPKKAYKIFKETCKIDFNDTTENVYNKIRGLSPYPTAWFELQSINKTIYSFKVFSATKRSGKEMNTAIETDNKSYLYIKTCDGAISIEELQLSGKNRMKTGDLLKGFKIENDWRLVY